MLAIKISIIIGSILMFWNIESFIRKNNKAPSLKDMFRENINSIDKRGYYFLIIVCLLLMINGVYLICSEIGSVDWNLTNISEWLIILLFLSVMGNYLVRLYIEKNKDLNIETAHEKFVWDAWSVRESDCGTSKEVMSLRVSNIVVIIIVALVIILKLI